MDDEAMARWAGAAFAEALVEVSGRGVIGGVAALSPGHREAAVQAACDRVMTRARSAFPSEQVVLLGHLLQENWGTPDTEPEVVS